MKKTGIQLISEERKHQIEKWGGKEHDAQYVEEELVIMAVRLLTQVPDHDLPEEWKVFSKHPDRIDQLKIAGAWCAAEIDRLNGMNGDEHENIVGDDEMAKKSKKVEQVEKADPVVAKQVETAAQKRQRDAAKGAIDIEDDRQLAEIDEKTFRKEKLDDTKTKRNNSGVEDFDA